MTDETESPAKFEPGTKINKLKIIQYIDSGGCGDIYSVQDIETNEVFAIKTENFLCRCRVDDCRRQIFRPGRDYRYQYSQYHHVA